MGVLDNRQKSHKMLLDINCSKKWCECFMHRAELNSLIVIRIVQYCGWARFEEW